MKLKNLKCLLPAATIVAISPTISMTSCGSIWGGFEAIDYYGFKLMQSKNKVSLKSGIKYKISLTYQVKSDDSSKGALILWIGSINGSDLNYLKLKDFEDIHCFINNEEQKLLQDCEDFPAFSKQDDDFYTHDELYGKEIKFNFKLKVVAKDVFAFISSGGG